MTARESSRGDIVLAEFPFADLAESKLRPVLILTPVPGPYPDYLVMFIGSDIAVAEPNLDLVLTPTDTDFAQTGLRVASVFRTLKLATLSAPLFKGRLGTLDLQAHTALVERIVQHLQPTEGDCMDGDRQPHGSALQPPTVS